MTVGHTMDPPTNARYWQWNLHAWNTWGVGDRSDALAQPSISNPDGDSRGNRLVGFPSKESVPFVHEWGEVVNGQGGSNGW